MAISKHKQARTLWIGNLPHWVDEQYLCLCFYLFDSVPSSRWPGTYVKIIRNKKTGSSSGYGFMTFQTREAAERILGLYSGLKIMPGTTNPFCMNWACNRSEVRTSRIKSIRSKNNSSYWKVKTIKVENNSQGRGFTNLSLFTIPDLPLDVIENILSWLPAKSIGRCGTTCIAWASLTSAPRFINQQLQNQKGLSDPIVAIESTGEHCNTCVFSNHTNEAVGSFRTMHFEFPFGFSQHKLPLNSYNVSNTCNGLVCVYESNSTKFASLVNPTIQETIQLPKSSNVPKILYDNICSMGIGYDECSDTYKIVRMFEANGFIEYGVKGVEYEAITLGDANCQWRHIGHLPYDVRAHPPPVFLHDTIYWLMTEIHQLELQYTVVAINVKTEIVSIIDMPEVANYCKLFVLEECLCIISKTSSWTSKINLYILEGNLKFNWVKKHIIEDTFPLSNPIANRDGKILLINTFICQCSDCIADTASFAGYCYDTKNGRFEKTTALPHSSGKYILYETIRGCAESLVSPISYPQRSNDPCPIFHLFGQRWAILFPANPSSKLS